MFDVSFTELMVIGVVALIVIGPERLPKVARTVGHLLGRAQRYVNDVKGDIRREIELDELRKFKTEMESAAQSVQTSLNDTQAALREPVQHLRQELDEAARDATAAVSGNALAGTEAVTGAASQSPAAESPASHNSAAGGNVAIAASAADAATPASAPPARAEAAATPAPPSATAAFPPADTAGKPPSPIGTAT